MTLLEVTPHDSLPSGLVGIITLGVPLPCCGEAQAVTWSGFLWAFGLTVSAEFPKTASTSDLCIKEPPSDPCSHLSSHASLASSRCGPRLCKANSSSTCSALSQSQRTESESTTKMIAVLPSQVKGGLFHSSRQQGRSLVPLLSAVDTGGLFRQERMLLRF